MALQAEVYRCVEFNGRQGQVWCINNTNAVVGGIHGSTAVREPLVYDWRCNRYPYYTLAGIIRAVQPQSPAMHHSSSSSNTPSSLPGCVYLQCPHTTGTLRQQHLTCTGCGCNPPTPPSACMHAAQRPPSPMAVGEAEGWWGRSHTVRKHWTQ